MKEVIHNIHSAASVVGKGNNSSVFSKNFLLKDVSTDFSEDKVNVCSG